ncbi:hypothetical protein MRX96_051622 [Rhipicephalus microplus]
MMTQGMERTFRSELTRTHLVHLVGSVQKASVPTTEATPALDANTDVITGDKTIFFDDLDKLTELTQSVEDNKDDATISDLKEQSKVIGVQTIFFPDTKALQSSLVSEVQITGATTIFGEGFTPILPGTQDSSEALLSSIQSSVVGGAKSVSGATTIFFQLDGERVPILPSVSTSLSTVTQYVTSVESFTRTLTLTTTKVYYTRDSPLTITSVFTTTIPPRTFVSTIIGSRTILGHPARTFRFRRGAADDASSERSHHDGHHDNPHLQLHHNDRGSDVGASNGKTGTDSLLFH